jgi:hypothetical protein
MTSEMNVLLNRLQDAIDEAISDSGRIADIVAEMKRSGHDLCLIVETSAAVSSVEDAEATDFVTEPRLLSNVPSKVSASNGDVQLTADDLAFLQEMNIAA